MYFTDFPEAIAHATAILMNLGVEVDAGSWQGYQTQGKPDLVTLELMNLQIEVPVDREFVGHQALIEDLRHEIRPNLPWADDHFAERVSRDPSNPGEAYRAWPWWMGKREAEKELPSQVGSRTDSGKFDHTYQERFWPKLAQRRETSERVKPREGIRYRYGDLDDVVNLLHRNPFTRQATFPIFFPEDTGAVHGGRTPCTLHYHFMMRKNRLNLWYPIRSCDLVRHFRDDLYLACRLLLWVLDELREKELRSDVPQLWFGVGPGHLFFTAYSFHIHKGDLHRVRQS